MQVLRDADVAWRVHHGGGAATRRIQHTLCVTGDGSWQAATGGQPPCRWPLLSGGARTVAVREVPLAPDGGVLGPPRARTGLI